VALATRIHVGLAADLSGTTDLGSGRGFRDLALGLPLEVDLGRLRPGLAGGLVARRFRQPSAGFATTALAPCLALWLGVPFHPRPRLELAVDVAWQRVLADIGFRVGDSPRAALQADALVLGLDLRWRPTR
jgi:hypothetical protein